MLSSAFLFHGENSYTLNTQLKKWKSSFVEKYGADALFEFTHQNRDPGALQQALYAGGLFVSKKMIICYGVPKDTYETNTLPTEKIEAFFDTFQRNAGQLSEDILVIFVSYKPDKRTKAFKRCNENLQIKEFSLYKEAELKTFIREQLAPLPIDEEKSKYLLLKIGNDMYRLESECQKLKSGLQAQQKMEITIADIDYYCFGQVEADAFSIFDDLFSNPNAAVLTLEKMQKDGKSWNEVAGLLTRGLKIYLTLLDFDKKGITSAKEIIAQTKLHPFVVNKNLKHISVLRTHHAFLIRFFKQLIQVEYDIKTGKTVEQYFRLTVKSLLLTLK